MELNTINPFENFSKVKEIWKELCTSNDVSYFLSWGWIENWIKSLPTSVGIRLVAFFDQDTPTLAFFIGNFTVAGNKKYKIISKLLRSRGLFLNATGIPQYDQLCLENNSMLLNDSYNISLKQIIGSLPYKWNEIFMPYLEPKQYPGKWVDETIYPYRFIIERNEISPFVDLEMVRRKNGDFPSLLSSNTRYQIKRSLRLYASRGEVRVETATNVNAAIKILEELAQLHNKSWRARGKKGAFESDYYYNFHKLLINSRFDRGEIQLIRISCGQMTVGCLYNFIHKKKVYFYQSGFAYPADNKLKPAFVCHVKAIRLNAKLGYSIYDFLHKPDRYKRSLATHERKLISVKIQNPSLLLSIEEKLINLVRHIAKR